MKKKNYLKLIKRNLPIFVTGTLLLTVFIIIIGISQTRRSESPDLTAIRETDVIAPHTYLKGVPNAPLVLVMFSDYTSKSELDYYGAMLSLYQDYRSHLSIAIRPYTSEPNAILVAKAAQVAGEQGRFWDYLDEIFSWKLERIPNKSDLILIADVLGLDEEKFSADMEDSKFDAVIEADISNAENLGITYTPAFFLNGEELDITDPEHLERLIKEEVLEAGFTERRRTSPILEDFDDENDLEPKERELTPIQKERQQEIYEIVFTEFGEWEKGHLNPVKGQRVRWVNSSLEAIILRPLDKGYENLNDDVPIEPGEYFEYTFPTGGPFRFLEANSRKWGMITIEW